MKERINRSSVCGTFVEIGMTPLAERDHVKGACMTQQKARVGVSAQAASGSSSASTVRPAFESCLASGVRAGRAIDSRALLQSSRRAAQNITARVI